MAKQTKKEEKKKEKIDFDKQPPPTLAKLEGLPAEFADNIVKPMIRTYAPQEAGKPKIPIINFLEETFQKDPESMPVMTAVGYMKASKIKNDFASYIVTFQGTKVLKIEIGEPNLRAIAEDEAKISFVTEFTDRED